MSVRSDGRTADQLRTVRMTPDFIVHAEGSVLIECGATRVVCTASLDERVPPFRRGSGGGWVTCEYGMLPRSTSTRMIRDSSKGRPSGRTQEIQRIIGRALRSVVDLDRLGERTIWLDCDVLQADGGTRTASITGAFAALALAIHKLLDSGNLESSPLLDYVAAVSVGIVRDQVMLDLAYEEDSTAQVDMNVVMTGQGRFVEIQGTAEASPFSAQQLNEMLSSARSGIESLLQVQRDLVARICGSPEAILRGETAATPDCNAQ